MKLLTTMALALSLCAGTVLPVAAENVVGTVKAWQYMQADGWKSADGLDNHTLSNALYGARVIDNYPWTRQFLLRMGYNGGYFLADKNTKTVRKLTLKTASGSSSDLTSVYQGEGKACGFTLIDTQASLLDEALQRSDGADNPAAAVLQARSKFAPTPLMVVSDKCVNPKQQAALAAKRSQKDRELQQWVAKKSMAELCRRTGNC
ncbi:TPA: hypothetical protein J1W43_002442 [Escherichia coli]|nr:hypothetical protein [Escherichia coli]HBA8270948.1 hypothetical protein [Escherichia coli]HBA8733552.1 hypothetical protein [Escherichia coli]HBB8627859.1 hypothetical protein [Escherichia coli]